MNRLTLGLSAVVAWLAVSAASCAACFSGVSIEQSLYGVNEAGEEIILYTLSADNGSAVEVCNLGATLISIKVPDRDGKIDDVLLGYPDYQNLIADYAYLGRTIGRVANRTQDGCMVLDGVEYQLERNREPHHLHGGSGGFSMRVWQSRIEQDRVVMTLHSADGDQGYPGAVDVEVIFAFDEHYTLQLTLRALSDATTAINLTNHAYFNLAGVGEPSVLDHELKLSSTRVLEMNDLQIPTGERLDIADTPMDLRSFRRLGDVVDGDFNHLQQFRGLDHYFEVDGWEPSTLVEHAQLRDKKSGRMLTLLSTSPGVMIYSGNWLSRAPVTSKSGCRFNDYEGVALECQVHPNALNTPSFPTIIYKAGEQYYQKIVFKFGTY